MPHLVVEASRGSLEKTIFTLPFDLDGSGKPTDILAPPKAIRRTLYTPQSTIRVQIIIEKLQLQAVPGSSQCSLNLNFDESSVEVLSANQSEGLLGGTISIPFALGFAAASVPGGSQIAQLVADFSNTQVGFSFDDSSKARLVAKVGSAMESVAETAIIEALTALFSSFGVQPFGLNFNLNPGMASENLLTVDALPTVVWLDAETVALSLEYAPEPTPFQPVLFLPGGDPAAFGLRMSNDGFQRTVRNPAVRKLAHDMLSDRLLDGFVQQVYTGRGGTGGATDQDRAEGQQRLDNYLKTPQGLADIANETPAPTGNGKLRKHIAHVPDPFSDFDVEIPNLDLWLGVDRIEGSGRATGVINGFGFTADVRFRARPVLITTPQLAIEMQDLQIDDPQISIDLPPLLNASLGILVAVIAGPVFGAIVAFLLSSIISTLVEAIIPSNLGSKVPLPGPQPVTSLPRGVDLISLTVVPDYLQILGEWYVFIRDPRPFWPTISIVDTVSVKQVAHPTPGTAWFGCLGALGVIMDSVPGSGSPFEYMHRSWQSLVTASLQTNDVPLPLTRFPCTIAIGYHSPEEYHSPVISVPAQPLVPGSLTVTSDVWRPEPPLRGQVVSETFTIDVAQIAEDSFTLSIPLLGCILIGLETKSIDAEGTAWDTSVQIDVVNETVLFGLDFDDFTKKCASHHRDYARYKTPSIFDKVWVPPDVYKHFVQEAIRTEQPGVTFAINSLIEAGGQKALQLMLAPSQSRRESGRG
jgi:hypothetical protein